MEIFVQEVEDAEAKLAEKCGYELHSFANMLRCHQKKSNWPIVSTDYLKNLRATKRKRQIT